MISREELALKAIRDSMQKMLYSAEPIIEKEGTEFVVTGYKIKTGALHNIIGLFNSGACGKDLYLTVPLVSEEAFRKAEDDETLDKYT